MTNGAAQDKRNTGLKYTGSITEAHDRAGDNRVQVGHTTREQADNEQHPGQRAGRLTRGVNKNR